jgi:hypothetical protein
MPGHEGFAFAPNFGHAAADPFPLSQVTSPALTALLANSTGADQSPITHPVHDALAMVHAHDFHLV